jgi:hypothetical protein
MAVRPSTRKLMAKGGAPPFWQNLLAGGAAGISELLVMYPLVRGGGWYGR